MENQKNTKSFFDLPASTISNELVLELGRVDCCPAGAAAAAQQVGFSGFAEL